jgi:hypothetical protein
VLGIDQEMNFKNSWSGYKWNTHTQDAIYTDEQLGEFTSRIPVMSHKEHKEVFSIYSFDTEMFKCGAELGLPGTNCVGSDAVSWFMEQQMKHSHQWSQRDFLFMHEPLQEFMFAANV